MLTTIILVIIAIAYIAVGIHIFRQFKLRLTAPAITKYKNLDAFIIGSLWIIFAMIGVVIDATRKRGN